MSVLVSEVSNKASGGYDIDKVYPVGSIYMSITETNPSELFGGVWEALSDRFLIGAGTTYTAGTTGGEATHVLTETEMPSHTHSMSGSTNAATPLGMSVSGSTSSSGSHAHSVDDRWTGSTSGGSWLARGSSSPDYRWGPPQAVPLLLDTPEATPILSTPAYPAVVTLIQSMLASKTQGGGS